MNNSIVRPNFSVPRRTAFRRAIMKQQELAWIRQQPVEQRSVLFSLVEPYRGRGKNHNYPFIKRIETGHFVGPAAKRDRFGQLRRVAYLYPVRRSKYFPHQGKREMARRA